MLPFLDDQPRMAKLSQMKRKRAVRDAECLGERPGRHALFAGLDQLAKYRQPVFLRQGAKRFDDRC